MSDSEDSAVTYTDVSSLFEDLLDIGSPSVDGLPMMTKDPYAYVVAAFQAPPSPDYVPGPEEPEQVPPSPEFVPEPVYSEFMPPEDEVFPPEEQPLHVVVSPTTNSPGYIADSDPEEDKEDLKEDLKEDPTDYPADGGDDDDDESSDEDEDDDDVEEDENEEEEEEEHPTPANSVPLHVHRVTARMSVRAQTPISLPSDTEVVRLLAIPTPPLSPLSILSSLLPQILSPLPHILSPPLPVSPLPLPASPTYPLGYRATMIRLRAETSSTSHPLLSTGVSEVTLLRKKRLCIALGPIYEARPEREVGYGITDTWDDMDTDEICGRLDDAQDDRLLMSGQLNMLRRDRCAHASTARLMETEARLSREAWVQSMDASDTARSEVRALRTTVLAQKTEIVGLRAVDHTRQT
ncbi:hypothetical protein Tco_1368072 [Tanacetum coccineum]